MTVEHDTVREDREYPHPPHRVYAAWADPQLKRRWFDLTNDRDGDWHSELRVDGTEHFFTAPGSTPELRYTAQFRDVVEDERIVATAEVMVGGRCATVSVTTVEFEPTPAGCRLRVVEQTAYLDQLDTPGVRRTGIAAQLRNLAQQLELEQDRSGP